MEAAALLATVKWNADGLAPVIIVDAQTDAVLTLAYANREALEKTLASQSTWLYSRSRAELWNKGATSGNTQRVVAVAIDCDSDALLYRVIPAGPGVPHRRRIVFQRCRCAPGRRRSGLGFRIRRSARCAGENDRRPQSESARGQLYGATLRRRRRSHRQENR